MKLPRFSPQGSVALPRFQAAQLPAPAMIRVRNEQYIPEETPQQAYDAKLLEGQPLVDLFKTGEQLWDVYAEAREKRAESEYELLKSEYKRDRTEARLEKEKNTPLRVDTYGPDGKKNGYVLPWKDAAEQFQTESDKVAEGMTSGADRRALKKFEVWRQEFDADSAYKLREWETDKNIDLHDYNTTSALEKAVEDRNDTEVGRIMASRRNTGYYDMLALDKQEEEALDEIEKGKVYDQIDIVRMSLDQRSMENVMDTQQVLLSEALKIQDDSARTKAIKDVLGLDEELSKGRTVVWEENYWAIQAEVADADTPEEQIAVYDKYLDRDDIEAALGNEMYSKLRDERDKTADNSIQTNDAVQGMLSEMVSQYEYDGKDYSGIRAEIKSRQRREYLHPDDAAVLLKRIDGARTKRVGAHQSKLEKDLNGYLDMKTDSTTGWARMRKKTSDEDEMRLQLEREKARQAIHAQVLLRADQGDLEQWVNSPEAAEFVFHQAMEAKQRAKGGTNEAGSKGQTAILTVKGQTFEGPPGNIQRKARPYIEKWDTHAAQGGTLEDWTGPTLEYEGETLAPSKDNLDMLRQRQ